MTQAAIAQAARASASGGLAGTILTSGQGVTAGQTTASKTLLG